MRMFFELDPSKADVRCKICKEHRYLIFDTLSGDRKYYRVLHSRIDQNADGLTMSNFIHWWLHSGKPYPLSWLGHYRNFTGDTVPECLSSYKEIKV